MARKSEAPAMTSFLVWGDMKAAADEWVEAESLDDACADYLARHPDCRIVFVESQRGEKRMYARPPKGET